MILLSTFSHPQVEGNVDLREFSFGKAWYRNDSSTVINELGNPYNTEGVISNGSVYFVENRIFDQHQIRRIIYAYELNSIHLQKITTDFFTIGDPFTDSLTSYSKSIGLMNCTVSQGFYIENSRLINNIFVSSLQNTGWIRISKSIFEKELYFWHGNYEKGIFDFTECDFKEEVTMAGSNFAIPFRIYNCTFDSTFILNGSKFKETFLVQDSKILNLLLRDCTFLSKPRFNRVTILDTIDFTNTNFEDGIDLRRIDFSRVKTIFLENTFYPPGELILYWEKIKGESKPRISLKDVSDDKDDNFKRIEEIYNRLYKNYIAQGDKTSADQVKYELAWQKEIMVGGIWQWLYGVTLGYGYEPVRYLFFPILVTVFLFWFIWYKFYYNIVAYILNKELDAELGLSSSYHVDFPTKKIKKLTVVDHKRVTKQINFFTRYWHSLHFSVSVLLGLRFKKEWMQLAIKHKYGKNLFLWMTTLEYALGKIYLILLLIFIKVHYFENWKSFLGF